VVRLYLSSFRLGYHPEFLVRMAGQAARVAVVANAMDGQPPDIGRQAVERELAALSELQLRPAELDLRGYAANAAPALCSRRSFVRFLAAHPLGGGPQSVDERGSNVFSDARGLASLGQVQIITGGILGGKRSQ
jgi:hypothetical protein